MAVLKFSENEKRGEDMVIIMPPDAITDMPTLYVRLKLTGTDTRETLIERFRDLLHDWGQKASSV